jgi:hypothetical protein
MTILRVTPILSLTAAASGPADGALYIGLRSAAVTSG